MKTSTTIQSDIKAPSINTQFNLLTKVKQLIKWIENATARSVSKQPIHTNINESAWHLI